VIPGSRNGRAPTSTCANGELREEREGFEREIVTASLHFGS
jgi:hypothetical protein